MSPSEVLVTGGRGALGREVVDRLRTAGREVRVLSRSGRPGTVRGDLSTGAGLDEAVRGVDTIVHCASNSFRKTRQTEVGGTEHLIRAAARAGVSRFVYSRVARLRRAALRLPPHDVRRLLSLADNLASMGSLRLAVLIPLLLLGGPIGHGKTTSREILNERREY